MSTKAKRILELLNDLKRKNRLVGEVNMLDQEDTSRVGTNDQEIKVLKEMNKLQEFENDNWGRRSV